VNEQSDKLYAERPGWGQGFEYDQGRHLAAYRFASELIEGARVLDGGCGEGFGTHTLTDKAREVVGVDYSPDAIAGAQRRWNSDNLSFRVGDLTAAPPADEAFDVVLNFQVIEHIDDDVSFLKHLKAHLTSGGKLVVTTPNILRSVSENPCHVREYRPEEFRARIAEVFDDFQILGVFGNSRVEEFDLRRARSVNRILRLDPLGLRRFIPQAIVYPVFAHLGKFVRKQASGAEVITVEDFRVATGDLAEALDLVAVCSA